MKILGKNKNNLQINYSSASMKYNDLQKNKIIIDNYMNKNPKKINENKANAESLDNFETIYARKNKNCEMKLNKMKGIKINISQKALINNSSSALNNKMKVFKSKSDRVYKSTAKKNELFLLK